MRSFYLSLNFVVHQKWQHVMCKWKKCVFPNWLNISPVFILLLHKLAILAAIFPRSQSLFHIIDDIEHRAAHKHSKQIRRFTGFWYVFWIKMPPPPSSSSSQLLLLLLLLLLLFVWCSISVRGALSSTCRCTLILPSTRSIPGNIKTW